MATSPQQPNKATPWTTWTWTEYGQQAEQAARVSFIQLYPSTPQAFIKLGLEPLHSVGICGFNAPEWVLADVAAMMAGGMACGIYSTNEPDAVLYNVTLGDADICVVEDQMQMAKFLKNRSKMTVKAFIQYKGELAPELVDDPAVMTWAEMMKLGTPDLQDALEERIKALKPEDCATLIFTSGTTANPKAVMVTHDNVTWTGAAIANTVRLGPTDRMVSFLPLSHIAANAVDIHACIQAGVCVTFAQPDALKGTLKETIIATKPTCFLAVPRVWEKFVEGMEIKLRKEGKWPLPAWLTDEGKRVHYAVQTGQLPGTYFGIMNSIGYKKVATALGLDQCRHAAVAAAPTRQETKDFLLGINIPLYEVFGASETTGPGTISVPHFYSSKAAGPTFEGGEISIIKRDGDDPASNEGEICLRGRNVFLGYLKNPDASAEAIDPNGWYHSGDKGYMDDAGFLHVTGRYKEIIITAGGENVPGGPIEEALKAEIGWLIKNVMIIGDRRKYLTALITLRSRVDLDTMEPTDDLEDLCVEHLAKRGIPIKSVTEANTHAGIHKIIEEGVAAVNKAAFQNVYRVKKFRILPRDFSVPGGELTPTMKVRRGIIEKRYSEVIDGMYEEEKGKAPAEPKVAEPDAGAGADMPAPTETAL